MKRQNTPLRPNPAGALLAILTLRSADFKRGLATGIDNLAKWRQLQCKIPERT